MNLQLIRDRVRQHAKKIVLVLAGIGAGGYAYNEYQTPDSIQAAMSRPVGETVKAEFTCKGFKYAGPSVGVLLNNTSYANAAKDGNLDDLLTVVLPPDVEGYSTKKEDWLGKKWVVKGTITEFDGRKQIEAREIESAN